MRSNRCTVVRFLGSWAAVLCICTAASPVIAGTFSGTFQGIFVNPALSGHWIDVNGDLQLADNSATAVYSGIGTNSLQWGDGNFAVPHSVVAFTGYSLVNAPADVEIALGEFSYTNGSSLLATLIFGATLEIRLDGDPSVETLVIQMQALSTTNRGAPKYDADFLSFDRLPNTFHVFEADSATAVLYGKIVGDPTLDPTRLGDVRGGGFLANGAVPEPSTLALLSLGGFGCLAIRRLRLSRRAVI